MHGFTHLIATSASTVEQLKAGEIKILYFCSADKLFKHTTTKTGAN